MLFWKKKQAEQPSSSVNLSWLQTDIHSHLIPGIDDGAQTIEDSLQLIRGLVQLGYKKLVTTPHVLWEVYPNTTEIITAGYQKLQQSKTNAGINIELRAAAE